MNRQVTQRIVGVMLLLLLAAIVTPFLLRSPEEVRVALDLSLPPPPESPAMAIEPVVTDAEVAEFDARISDERASVRRIAEDAESVAGPVEETAAGQGTGISAADLQDDVRDEEISVAEPAAAEPAAQLSGWAVQVGSFSRLSGAESLAQQLRDAGYRALPVRSNNPSRPCTGSIWDQSWIVTGHGTCASASQRMTASACRDWWYPSGPDMSP